MHYTKKIILRRPFTLIEVIISCTLFACIIAAIFFWIHSSQYVGNKIEKKLARVQEIECCQLLLKRLIQSTQLSRKGEFFFNTSNINDPKLFFTCLNGVDPDPRFSNEVLVGLWVDNQKQFIMTMWPSITHPEFDETPQRNIVLLKNVQSISWNFLVPPDADPAIGAAPSATTTKMEPGSWVVNWPFDLKRMPLAASLIIEFEPGKSYTLSFVLPASAQPIQVER